MISLLCTLSNVIAFAGWQKDIIFGSAAGDEEPRYTVFSAG